ncbi:MAG: hypothetical protein EAX90_10520 [Candidatus Heimdallarchaeota archaeon]|nr:hypothetical protein [Candidatus Heimdallarchaeota archaeon]
MILENAFVEDIINQNYDLGELISINSLESGHESDNVMIETLKGKFVFKCFSQEAENIRESFILQDLLFTKGVKLPQPIKTNNNDFVAILDSNKTIAIQSFVPGKPVALRDKQPKKMLSLMGWFGKYLGEFHYLSKSITKEEIKKKIKRESFFNQASGLKWMIEIYEKADSILPIHEKNQKILREFELYLTETAELFKNNLSLGIIQSDLKPGDFFVENNNFTGILDFNGASYAHLMNELGTWIMYTSLYKPENKTFFQDFIKSYLEYSKVPSYELKYIPLFLKGRAFVQFFYFAYRICHNITQGLEEGETNMDGFQDGIDLVERSLEINPNYFFNLANSIIK